MAISKMPAATKPAEEPKPASEKKIQEYINKGGKPTSRGEEATDPNQTKAIKIIFKSTEMDAIKLLRDKRPAGRNRKLSISVHDWVIEAVQEKIQRDQEKYGLTLI
ncbi:hypothetical protein GCM10027592_56710 [Spirosoma flavus]